MMTISLCMIVKNEENTLERCLDSAKAIADEIIIVDTGSSDATKEIASKYTDKVFDFVWINDFSAARNYSFDQATMDYIMWLDADDVILPDDAAGLLKMKQSQMNEVDVVMMKYNTGFDSLGNVTFSYFRERILKRSRSFKWFEPVHEYLAYAGNIIYSDLCITHSKQQKMKSTRNIDIYEELLNNRGWLSTRGTYYYARELKDHGRHEEAATWFNTFLDLNNGWKEDRIAACGELAKSYQALGKKKESLDAMLRSFYFDAPRAEICCLIGYYFKSLKQYRVAAFWFELILKLDRPKNDIGFCQPDCWGYIPCLECAVCYDKLADFEKAAGFNEKAAEYKPGSPAVLHNREYFNSKILRP